MLADAAIAITGLGLATSLGLSPEDTFDAVAAGRCGLAPMPALEQTPVHDKGGGQALPLVRPPDPELPRESQYLRYAIQQAFASAGTHSCDSQRIAVVMGTTLHGMRAAGRALRSGDHAELRQFSANAVLSQAVRGLGLGGVIMSTCSACSSGLSAVALAVSLLRADEADMVVAGGYDAVSEYAYAGFDSLRLLAAALPHPFGAQRDGMKTAEGYGVLILERAGDAQARRARVRGFIAGFGESADSHHLTQPHPQGVGAAAAIRMTLGQAGLAPADIGLVCAHATSTPNNDAAEYAALASVFGDGLASTPVVAFKSHLGHTLGGAGAVELVLAVVARERGIIPPTINAEPVDEAFANLRLVRGTPMPASFTATLNLSLGFGGANTCVAVTSERPGPPAFESQEAVITGLGIVLPGAVGRDAFVQWLHSGHARTFLTGGPIPEDAIAHLLNARRVRRMSDYVKLTLAATSDACGDAGIADLAEFASGASVLLGTAYGSANYCESYYGQIVREGLAAANPVQFAEGVPNSGAAQLSLMLGIRGACQTIIGSRTAGLEALRLAVLRIGQGVWSRVFVGAAEEFSKTITSAHAACGVELPAGHGAGAVSFVLESRSAAMARGARILATIEAGSACSGAPWSAAARFVSRGGEQVPLVTALGSSRPDRLVQRRLQRTTKRPRWSIATALPELFSVGPLAGLAALILAPGQIPCLGPRVQGPVDVLATDFCNGATGVRVWLPGTTPSPQLNTNSGTLRREQ